MGDSPKQSSLSNATGMSNQSPVCAQPDVTTSNDISNLSQDLDSSLHLRGSEAHKNMSADAMSRLQEYQKKLEHANKTISEKQVALDELKSKYNELMIKLLQSEKDQSKLQQEIQECKEKVDANSASAQYHPGGDASPSGKRGDDSHALLESKKENAELKHHMEKYYNLVMQTDREKKELVIQMQNYMVDNKKFAQMLDDAARQRDALLTKVSKLQSMCDLLTEEREKLKENFQNSESPHQQHSTSSEIENFKSLVVQLKSEKEKLQTHVSNNERHIREQEEKIEKLTVRCALAEGTPSRPMTNHPTILHLQKTVEEKDEKISSMEAVTAVDKGEIERLKKEIEELRSTTNPDTIAFQEQIKAFQDDWFAERHEKETLLEKSQRLQKDNANLRRELDRAHFISPTSRSSQPRNFGITTPSPPVLAHQQPLDYSQHGLDQNPRQPGQSNFSTTQPYHSLQRSYGNTIPPRNYTFDGGAQHSFYPPDAAPNFYSTHVPFSNSDMNHPSFTNPNTNPDSSTNRSTQLPPPNRNMQR